MSKNVTGKKVEHDPIHLLNTISDLLFLCYDECCNDSLYSVMCVGDYDSDSDITNN